MERPGRLLEPRNLPTDGTRSLCIFLDSSMNVPTDQQFMAGAARRVEFCVS